MKTRRVMLCSPDDIINGMNKHNAENTWSLVWEGLSLVNKGVIVAGLFFAAPIILKLLNMIHHKKRATEHSSKSERAISKIIFKEGEQWWKDKEAPLFVPKRSKFSSQNMPALYRKSGQGYVVWKQSYHDTPQNLSQRTDELPPVIWKQNDFGIEEGSPLLTGHLLVLQLKDIKNNVKKQITSQPTQPQKGPPTRRKAPPQARPKGPQAQRKACFGVISSYEIINLF